MDTSNGAGGEASNQDIQFEYIEYDVYAAAGLTAETVQLGDVERVDFGAFLLPVAEGATGLAASIVTVIATASFLL
jgi:hypothetical protein